MDMDALATQKEIGQYVRAWADTFFIAVHEWNFKDGAFKRQIKRKTNVLDGFDIFIASSQLSKDEKIVFSEARASFVKALVGGLQMTSWEVTMEMASFTERVTDIFEGDSKKRGIYIPPTMVQSFEANGRVAETFEVTSEGVKTTAGGEAGVPPSAHESFNQKQRDAGPFNTGKKKPVHTDDVPSKKPTADKAEKTDYDEGFKKNLRGAFI